MLNEVLDYLNNYFIKDAYYGEFSIVDGKLADVDFLSDGQYFKVCGSVFNDGVFQYPAYGLIDETFSGELWALAIPPAIISLAHEISDWQTKYGEAVASPFQSESFGGYSYSKGSAGSDGGSSGWKSSFGSKLNRWRKLKMGVDVNHIPYKSSLQKGCIHHELIERCNGDVCNIK